MFTLNPGQKVESVSDSTGKPLDFINENGLLNITLPQVLKAGGETSVHLTVHGPPDDRFVYLYSSYNPEDSTGRESGDLPLLGLIPSLFDKDFIALMQRVREKLVELAKGDENYASILITSSGTGAVEAILSSCVDNLEKILI